MSRAPATAPGLRSAVAMKRTALFVLSASVLASLSAAPDAWADPPQAEAPAHTPWTAFAATDRGVGITRDDGTFSVAAHLVAWTRLDVNLGDATAFDFRVPIARPSLRGNFVRPWITFFLQPELAGTPRLLDAEVTVNPTPWFGVRFGQFIPPFSRQFLVAPMRLLFSDFAMSNTVFRVDRSRGVEVFGQLPSGRLEWHAAVTDANTLSAAANEGDHARVYGRVGVTPWGRNVYSETPGLDGGGDFFTFALNATWATVNRAPSNGATTPGVPVSTTSLGVDVALHVGRVYMQGEGYARSLGDGVGGEVWSAGGYGQVGVTLLPRRLDLAGRADVLVADVSSGLGLTRRAEALVAGYLDGNHLKAQLRYAYTDADAGSPVTPAGASHQVSLQAQLFF